MNNHVVKVTCRLSALETILSTLNNAYKDVCKIADGLKLAKQNPEYAPTFTSDDAPHFLELELKYSSAIDLMRYVILSSEILYEKMSPEHRECVLFNSSLVDTPYHDDELDMPF